MSSIANTPILIRKDTFMLCHIEKRDTGQISTLDGPMARGVHDVA